MKGSAFLACQKIVWNYSTFLLHAPHTKLFLLKIGSKIGITPSNVHVAIWQLGYFCQLIIYLNYMTNRGRCDTSPAKQIMILLTDPRAIPRSMYNEQLITQLHSNSPEGILVLLLKRERFSFWFHCFGFFYQRGNLHTMHHRGPLVFVRATGVSLLFITKEQTSFIKKCAALCLNLSCNLAIKQCAFAICKITKEKTQKAQKPTCETLSFVFCCVVGLQFLVTAHQLFFSLLLFPAMKRCPIAAKIAGSIGILPCCVLLFFTWVWMFARFVRPLLATILSVWEIWSGTNNHSITYHVFHWLAKKLRLNMQEVQGGFVLSTKGRPRPATHFSLCEITPLISIIVFVYDTT